jgi:hypothetical protein
VCVCVPEAHSLGYRKVSWQWVPKLLDDLNKAKRMMTSLPHLLCYSKEDESFLDLGSKQQSTVWKHPSLSVGKKFRRTPPIGKLMLTDFWDCRGPLLISCHEVPWSTRTATVAHSQFCEPPSGKSARDSRGQCDPAPWQRQALCGKQDCRPTAVIRMGNYGACTI